MKKALATILLLATLAYAIAQTVSYDVWFSWTPNPSSELVTGYRIEYQKHPVVTNWTYITYISSTNVALVKGLQPGYIYKFRAFAINAIGMGTNLSDIVQIPSNTPTAVIDFKNTPK